MTKRARVILVVALAGGALLWWLWLRDGAARAALEASGTVEATEADLGFQVPGRLARIGPAEGDDVTAGHELAALDTAELQATRSAAAAQVEAARARLSELERGARREELARAEAAARAACEQEAEAERVAARTQRLFEGGAVSRSERDRAATALKVATAVREQAEQSLALVREGPRAETLEAQRALLRQAEANLGLAEATLANAVIVAPFAGRVTVRHREPGETVAPGAPVLTLLDPDDRWVRIYVPGDRIGWVAIGQTATITADSWPERAYEGRVVRIGSEAEFTPRNVQTPEERTQLVYPVKVRVTGDPDFDLKPGIPADVQLDVSPEGP